MYFERRAIVAKTAFARVKTLRKQTMQEVVTKEARTTVGGKDRRIGRVDRTARVLRRLPLECAVPTLADVGTMALEPGIPEAAPGQPGLLEPRRLR